MRKFSTTAARIAAVTAATAGFMIAGSAAAGAEPADASIDPTCLEEGTEAVLADPLGTVEETLHDPIGVIEAEVACVEEVIGL